MKSEIMQFSGSATRGGRPVRYPGRSPANASGRAPRHSSVCLAISCASFWPRPAHPTSRREVGDAPRQLAAEVAAPVHSWRERLERERTRVAIAPQLVHLCFCAQHIARTDEDAPSIIELVERHVGVVDPGDVHDAGALGKQLGFAGEAVMERVVDEQKLFSDADRVDRLERRPAWTGASTWGNRGVR